MGNCVPSYPADVKQLQLARGESTKTFLVTRPFFPMLLSEADAERRRAVDLALARAMITEVQARAYNLRKVAMPDEPHEAPQHERVRYGGYKPECPVVDDGDDLKQDGKQDVQPDKYYYKPDGKLDESDIPKAPRIRHRRLPKRNHLCQDPIIITDTSSDDDDDDDFKPNKPVLALPADEKQPVEQKNIIAEPKPVKQDEKDEKKTVKLHNLENKVDIEVADNSGIDPCHICTVNKPTTVAFPCGHAHLCFACTINHFETRKNNLCPECNLVVESVTTFYN